MNPGTKVLLVDDDYVERQSLKRALSRAETVYDIAESGSAQEALDLMEEKRFDVVLMDYQLPGISGIEAIIKVRNMPQLKNTAIVMVSNFSDDELIVDCINAGAQDFLLKEDVTPSQLKRSILQSQKRNELEQQLFESYQKVKKLAERDPLTGLFNRYHFDETLKHMLKASQRYGNELVAVMFLDLDKFKHINDTYGHETGDKLLISVTNRIKTVFRGNELLARLGGDEFAFVCSQLSTVRQSKVIAKRLLGIFNTPFEIDGHGIHCSGSIGISMSPVNGDSVTELMKLADIAMYRAKQISGQKICLFEDNMQDEFLKKYRIESELRRAISDQAFLLNFQPIIRDGHLVGAESLVRWPTGVTTQKPDEFIPIAEESGLIHPLGKWIFETAVKTFSDELSDKESAFYLTINVSPHQLSEKGFASFVEQILNIHRVYPPNLVIEITETALLSEDEFTLEALNALSRLGINIALDDFGTGFSSISHLLNCPINIVKVDKSITQKIADAESMHRQMLEGLSFMVKKFGIELIAEGVETEEQANVCLQVGISKLQGYYFSKPTTDENLFQLLSNEKQGNWRGSI